MKTTGLSLKYKLLVILVALPLVTLGLYLLLALDLFRHDKEAYVFDSSVSVSRTLAAQVRSTLTSESAVLRTIVEARDSAGLFTDSAKSRAGYEPDIDYIAVLKPDESHTHYQVLTEIRKPSLADNIYSEVSASLDSSGLQASEDGRALMTVKDSPDGLLLTVRFGERADAQAIVATVFFHAPSLIAGFDQAQLYQTVLLNKLGESIIGVSNEKAVEAASAAKKVFYQMTQKKLPEGTLTVALEDGSELLASYSKVDNQTMTVITTVPKSLAFQAVKLMATKSILFFVALLLASLVVSVVASGGLTASLRALSGATESIAQGKFDIDIPVRSRDEVGILSKNFNTMAKEVVRLLNENIDKGRMEKELETAKIVQDTLFPNKIFSNNSVEICGQYEPASECGGDWWYYFEHQKKVFVCIGDVTGHGAPAALITSAARSAVALIEEFEQLTPAKFLNHLNRAIFEASKGHIQMTFFVACLDSESRKVTFANASHEAPYLIPGSISELKKKDLLPLLSTSMGNRLGQVVNSTYTEDSFEFKPGDRIFFYTDGLMDVQNPEGESWEERRMIKNLIKSANETKNTQDFVAQIFGEAQAYRQDSELVDDVTFIACQFFEVKNEA